MGNFPESCEVHATNSADIVPQVHDDDDWTMILPRTTLGPHRQHQFQLENVGRAYTHIKVTIYPDGGIKRVRVIGRMASGSDRVASAQVIEPLTTAPASASPVDASPTYQSDTDTLEPADGRSIIPALALTAEAFAPFGQVVQAYADVNAVPDPRSTRITGANQGTAVKFHKLALLESSYPLDSNATTGISVYRCKPIEPGPGGVWAVKLLERHSATKQAFIPMGEASGYDSLESPGKRYLVVVAHNGEDDKPDLRTMRSFIVSAGQGIMYNTGIWRECCHQIPQTTYISYLLDHPMAVLDGVSTRFHRVHLQFVADGSTSPAHGLLLRGDTDRQRRPLGLRSGLRGRLPSEVCCEVARVIYLLRSVPNYENNVLCRPNAVTVFVAFTW